MSRPGVTSYRGFLYQQEFFFKFLLENINQGDFDIGFEVVDDVSVESKVAKINYRKTLAQLKSGILSDDDLYKIFENWILETDLEHYRDYKYMLVSEQKTEFDLGDDFLLNLKKYINQGEQEDIRSIKNKVFNKLKELSPSCIDELLEYIKLNCDIIDDYKIEQIKEDQFNLFDKKFCIDIDKELTVAKKERFDFVKQKIINELIDNIELKLSYKISNADFQYHLIKGCQKYGNELFEPDFIEFKKNKASEQILAILNGDKLEVKQLRLAERTAEQIYDDVLRELFYRHLIEFYKEKDENLILSTHIEARDNYKNALDKIEFEGKEKTPKNVYIVTTQTPIQSKIIAQTGQSSFLQKGCYIHMTSQEVNDDLRIQWGDIK